MSSITTGVTDLNNETIDFEEALRILRSIGETCNRKFVLNHRLDILKGLHTKDRIEIGIRNICDPGFGEDPLNIKYESDNSPIPILNFVSALITIMHEKRHVEQVDDLIQQSDGSEDEIFIALDYLANQYFEDYYKDCVGGKGRNAEYTYEHNYLLMAHEIDAEKFGWEYVYHFLCDELDFEEGKAENLIIKAVNNKIKKHYTKQNDYTIKYWIGEDGLYNSLEKIMDDFDNAFKKAKITHRKVNKTMLDAHRSIVRKVCYRDKNVLDHIADSNAKGFLQAQMIACVVFRYNPKLKDKYPILQKYTFDEEKLFGRRIQLSIKDRLFAGKISSFFCI